VAGLQLAENLYPCDLSMFDQSHSYTGHMVRGHPGGNIIEQRCLQGVFLGQGWAGGKNGYCKEEQYMLHVIAGCPKLMLIIQETFIGLKKPVRIVFALELSVLKPKIIIA